MILDKQDGEEPDGIDRESQVFMFSLAYLF